MLKSPPWPTLLATALLLAGSTVAQAQPAAPSVEQMLDARFAPKQKDVPIATPAAADYKDCTVHAIAGSRPGSTGWELLDGKKQPLRRYFGGKGAKGGVDTWCYFKDGVEVYREIDSNSDGIPDQFRWLNAAGLKWGMDLNGDGKIDSWRIIAAEEVGHEAFQALATGDFARLQALFISPDEMRAIKLPAKEIDRISSLQKQAAKKFADLLKAQPQIANGHFERVEGAVPSCVPAEAFGGASDLIKFSSCAMLYQAASKKHEWLHTGELIQVGFAWRLIDVPTVEEPSPTPGSPATAPQTTDPRLKDLLGRLEKLDEDGNRYAPNDPKVKPYLEARVALVTLILQVIDAKEHDSWYKQIFDNLSTLAQAGHPAAMRELTALSNRIARSRQGSSLAAYGVYRTLWADYAVKLESGKDIEKLQKSWIEQLRQFVQDYPKAEDTTPDALHQLAMHTEFAGKDDEAKRWYKTVCDHFADHYLAEKCRGAVRRLDLPGKKLELTAPQLQSGAPFDIGSIKDKLVVVYFWASYCNQCVGDFARLNKLYDTHPGKLELISINLDDSAEQAAAYLKSTPVRGIQLVQPGAKGASGMSSPLAVHYGINGLPTVFLIGRDGRVVNRAMQVSDLENEMKKGQ